MEIDPADIGELLAKGAPVPPSALRHAASELRL